MQLYAMARETGRIVVEKEEIERWVQLQKNGDELRQERRRPVRRQARRAGEYSSFPLVKRGRKYG
jgi:hypothetical protein